MKSATASPMVKLLFCCILISSAMASLAHGTEERFAFRPNKVSQELEPGSLIGSAGLHYFTGYYDDTKSGSLFNGSLGVIFTKTYYVGIDIGYRQPFGVASEDVLDPMASNGFQDTKVYVGDRNFYSNAARDFKLSSRLTLILPTSIKAQNATTQVGGSFDVTATEKLQIATILAAAEFLAYSYQYDSVYINKPNPDGSEGTTQVLKYNSPFGMLNRIGINFNLGEKWHWNNGGTIFTRQDYSNAYMTIFSFSTGIGYNIEPQAVVDLSTRYRSMTMFDNTLYDGSKYTLDFGLTYRL